MGVRAVVIIPIMAIERLFASGLISVSDIMGGNMFKMLFRNVP